MITAYDHYDVTENHQVMKLSASHHLIDISKKPTETQMTAQSCLKHDELPFEYFCVDHDVICCTECLVAISDRSVFKVRARRNACLSDPCFSTNSNVSFSLVMCSSICFVSNISFCAFDANLSFYPLI
jgi:hypothetical protein